jgi:hypothetical protein
MFSTVGVEVSGDDFGIALVSSLLMDGDFMTCCSFCVPLISWWK